MTAAFYPDDIPDRDLEPREPVDDDDGVEGYELHRQHETDGGM